MLSFFCYLNNGSLPHFYGSQRMEFVAVGRLGCGGETILTLIARDGYHLAQIRESWQDLEVAFAQQ